MSGAAPRRPGGHEAFDELAVGWALHALEPEDEAVFARHLPDCPRCARTIAETGEVMAALASELPPAEPSEELGQRLRAAVEETGQVQRPALPADEVERSPAAGTDEPAARSDGGTPPRGPVPAGAEAWHLAGRPAGWRSRVPQALLAAAVAAVLALGVSDISLMSSRDRAQTVAADQAQILDALMTPGQATVAPVSDRDGHAVATVVARHGQAQVVTWGLGMNNRQQTTYVLWGMQQGSPVALGMFDVVSARMDLRSVGSDRTGLNGYSGYAISIEPGRTMPTSPSDIVANGQVSS